MTQYFPAWGTFPGSSLWFSWSWDLPWETWNSFGDFFFSLPGKSREENLLGITSPELQVREKWKWRTAIFCSKGFPRGSEHPIQEITFPNGFPERLRVGFGAPPSPRRAPGDAFCVLALGARPSFKERPCGQSEQPTFQSLLPANPEALPEAIPATTVVLSHGNVDLPGEISEWGSGMFC